MTIETKIANFDGPSWGRARAFLKNEGFELVDARPPLQEPIILNLSSDLREGVITRDNEILSRPLNREVILFSSKPDTFTNAQVIITRDGQALVIGSRTNRVGRLTTYITFVDKNEIHGLDQAENPVRTFNLENPQSASEILLAEELTRRNGVDSPTFLNRLRREAPVNSKILLNERYHMGQPDPRMYVTNLNLISFSGYFPSARIETAAIHGAKVEIETVLGKKAVVPNTQGGKTYVLVYFDNPTNRFDEPIQVSLPLIPNEVKEYNATLNLKKEEGRIFTQQVTSVRSRADTKEPMVMVNVGDPEYLIYTAIFGALIWYLKKKPQAKAKS